MPAPVGNETTYSANSTQQSVELPIVPPHAGDVTPGSGTSSQSQQMSMIIPTLPYHFRHASPSGSNASDAPEYSVSEPDSIDSLMVKVSCRKEKVERNFILAEVDIKDIRTLKDLRFYLAHQLPIRALGSVGYVVKGRKKVCFHTDDELQKLIDTTLSKGKGELWCDCVMQGEGTDDVKPTGVHDKDTSTEKRRKVSVLDERRERVQNLFDELKEKHGSAYSAPQYRLWAEAICSGAHTSTDAPPLGSMFRRQSTSKGQCRSHCSCSATAIASVNLTSSPPQEDQAHGSSTSLTPKSVASLRSAYIKQIKELHELLELDAISTADFQKQKEKILAMMDSL